MRYIKNYTDYILESKINYNWNDFFLSILDDITDKKSRAKLEQLLVRDIFSNANEFLYTDDIKTYSQLPSIKKFDMLMDIKYNSYMVEEYAEMLTSIKDALLGSNANISNYKTLYDLAIFADEWHENLDIVVKKSRSDETPNTDKFIVYPNGWYWINLNTDFSEDEKQNMGHCGRDDGKILFSLRDDEKQSHITVSYNPNNKTVYQIKGRKNTKPKSIYHKYIIDMLLNDKHVINIIGTGWYKPELDFSLLDISEEDRNEIMKKKPCFVYTSAMFEKYFNDDNLQMVISMCSNGYIYDGNNIKKYSTEEEVSGFIETVDKYKIKDKDILKNIITSCCLLRLNNIQSWSNELLIYMRNIGVTCESGTSVSIKNLKRLIQYLGYKPSPFLIRSYIDYGDTDILEYIVSIYGKIKFDAAYFQTITTNSDVDYTIESLDIIFDFSDYECKLLTCIVDKKFKNKLSDIVYLIASKTNKKDITFLTHSVISTVSSISQIGEMTQYAFDIYTKAFNINYDDMFKHILKELSVDGTPRNITIFSILSYNAAIADKKTILDSIKENGYINTKGDVVMRFITSINDDNQFIINYLNTTDDINYTIQILDSQYADFDIYHSLSDERKNEIKQLFNEDFILKDIYKKIYKIISN